MSTLPLSVRICLIGVALIHAAPIVGVLGEAWLQQAYALGALDASTELLLRHRAVMFGLLAAGLVAALWQRALLAPMLLGTALSDVAFNLLVFGGNQSFPALLPLAGADIVSLLLTAFIVWRFRGSAQPR